MPAEDRNKELRRQLQDLAGSDPAAQVNMLRHVAALSMMIGLRTDHELREGEATVLATFQMTDGELDMQMSITGRTRVDRVLIAFDIDDASGPPLAIGVVRVDGERVLADGGCRLWSPAGVGRSLLVPMGKGSSGYFSTVGGRALRYNDGPLPGDPTPGIKRGSASLVKLARSDQFSHIESGFMQTVNSQGSGLLTARTAKISARERERGPRG